MPKRLLVMAGGTGGHVFPGIAVAKHLQQQGWEILWLGTPKRMEAQLVPAQGFDIAFIDIEGVRGNGIKRLLQAPFKLLTAILTARKILKSFRPDVVLGMGGFASGPGGVAAWTLGIPLVLHEQNAVAGLTNKWLAKIAKSVLSGFDGAFNGLGVNPNKLKWVGNPVRESFFALHQQVQPHQSLRVLVVGGSLGAKVLNDAVPEALAEFQGIHVRHQTGAGNQALVQQKYAQTAPQIEVVVDEFIHEMADAYGWADLVICRAGALTVAEIAAAGLPAIFVPLPHAVDDHQTKNASVLVKNNAAWLLPQAQLERGELVPLLKQILADKAVLSEMGERAKSQAKIDAVDQVAACCHDLAEQYA